MLYDPTYILVIPALIFALVAQCMVKSTFSKYSQIRNRRGVTAAEVARKILDENGLYDVRIERVSGELTDHYDPRTNVVRLSDSVYNSTSVAAVGVAAHETGHAIQHSVGYAPIKIRNAILPVAQIGSQAAMPLVLIGLIFSRSLGFLIDVGIIVYVAVVLFQLVTLPVEFNASGRALHILEGSYILENDENKMAKKVLTAAAMTYVAALFSALTTLLRLVLISNNRRR
ncbi:MAG: zinc metallopeptidase [Oscillospiraceae bacterium]|nr:zinc metallopeptidase [Oscillospiraceae bacterium]